MVSPLVTHSVGCMSPSLSHYDGFAGTLTQHNDQGIDYSIGQTSGLEETRGLEEEGWETWKGGGSWGYFFISLVIITLISGLSLWTCFWNGIECKESWLCQNQ